MKTKIKEIELTIPVKDLKIIRNDAIENYLNCKSKANTLKRLLESPACTTDRQFDKFIMAFYHTDDNNNLHFKKEFAEEQLKFYIKRYKESYKIAKTLYNLFQNKGIDLI